MRRSASQKRRTLYLKRLMVSLLLIGALTIITLSRISAFLHPEGYTSRETLHSSALPVIGRQSVMAMSVTHTDRQITDLTQVLPADETILSIAVPISGIPDTHLLELVNRDYAVNYHPNEELLVRVRSLVPGDLLEDPLLHITALQALGELFAAAAADGVGSLMVSSGYRDLAAQRLIYYTTEDKSYVMLPGYSEHHTGLAVDIMGADTTANGFGWSQEDRWLADNAWRYGFIQRYPQNKQQITGVAWEPWHYRYVGLPHAWFCYQYDLALEEYIQFLRDGEGYQIDLFDTVYSVLSQFPHDDILYLPQGLSYDVSTDNTGAYIVTTWR